MINIKNSMDHWIESGERDFKTMNNLFKSKDYSWSLFVGHLVIEKFLKACYIKNNHQHPLMIHNLVRLAETSGISPTENQKRLFTEITSFNLSSRYDDYKKSFYVKCTPEYTKEWIKQIKQIRKWIKEEHLK